MFPRLALALVLVAPILGAAFTELSVSTSSAAQAPAPPKPAAVAPATLRPDPPMTCTNCAEWNTPRAPFKVFGNTYFVGSLGLSSLLIVTDAGLVLIDVALPQSAPLIDANIRTLGFGTTDVKYILSSHAHYDHVGGMRSMQRFTRATVLASSETARALGLGHPVPEDPQFEADASQNFPAFTDGVRAVKDGEVTRLGATAITAHRTPGHTPGATTWTWQSCEGARCLNMVYVDSLTAVANDTFRFTGGNGRPSIVEGFRASLRKVAALPCDVVISTHPSATGMDDKLARRTKAGLAPGAPGDPFVDAGACKALAEVSMKALEARVAGESKR
jgi:metallo-beta-lactamase class B